MVCLEPIIHFQEILNQPIRAKQAYRVSTMACPRTFSIQLFPNWTACSQSYYIYKLPSTVNMGQTRAFFFLRILRPKTVILRPGYTRKFYFLKNTFVSRDNDILSYVTAQKRVNNITRCCCHLGNQMASNLGFFGGLILKI